MPTKVNSTHKSVKHSIISKSYSNTFVVVGIAVFVVIFCLFASRALIIRSLYLSKVTDEKESSLNTLRANQNNINDLSSSYNAFISRSENVLGGNPAGDGPLDGRNDKITLDSLPDEYDFPALSSSFEKILKDGGYSIDSIGGTEDVSLALNDESIYQPQPIEIPYSFSFTDSAERTEELLEILERSIRPMYVDQLDIAIGAGGALSATVSLHTYFTYGSTFETSSKVVE